MQPPIFTKSGPKEDWAPEKSTRLINKAQIIKYLGQSNQMPHTVPPLARVLLVVKFYFNRSWIHHVIEDYITYKIFCRELEDVWRILLSRRWNSFMKDLMVQHSLCFPWADYVKIGINCTFGNHDCYIWIDIDVIFPW